MSGNRGRREFLKKLGLGAGALAGVAAGSSWSEPSMPRNAESPSTFPPSRVPTTGTEVQIFSGSSLETDGAYKYRMVVSQEHYDQLQRTGQAGEFVLTREDLERAKERLRRK